MRKLILIAALVLVSATAQAETRRGLTVASNEATATETTNAAETPKYAARSAAVDMKAQRLKAEQAKRRAAHNALSGSVDSANSRAAQTGRVAGAPPRG